MLRVNGVLAAAVAATWLVLGNDEAWSAVRAHWPVSLTMTLGSLVGGGTSEGGGAIAFPILTKALGVAPEQARLFSFAIQSVGMGAASASIILSRVPIEWRALAYGGPAAVAAVVGSCLFVSPRVNGTAVRLVFTAVLVGLAVALLVSRRARPLRRTAIERFGRPERALLVLAGAVGGLLSGLAAVGENTIMFVLLVLGFRVCERVVTPTTVVLMTMVTIAGFATHVVAGDFTGEVVSMWLAAVPIVAIGAPLGALICTRITRGTIARILLVLIGIEVVSTALLVPMTATELLVFSSGIVIFVILCAVLTLLPRYDVDPESPFVAE